MKDIDGQRKELIGLIDMRLKEKTEIVTDADQTDEKFFTALHDVCTLNLMRDSVAGKIREYPQ